VITSLKNPKVKLARGLSNSRKIRRSENAFFIEGVHAITAAQRNRWELRYVYYCPENKLTEWAQVIVAQTPEDRLIPVNMYVQMQLSDRESASEVMAVVEKSSNDLSRITLHKNLLVLVLDRPRSPGNLGSAVRSADALGAHGVLITGHAVDLYDPRTVRATMGSLFELPAVYVQEHTALESWLAHVRETLGNLQVVATSAHASQQIWEQDFTGPSVIVIGNETVGLSQYYRNLCDVFLSIPMHGGATSMNASVAASVFLYEARRQRDMQTTSSGTPNK
jgi:TrmH family RNA methyltransferase